MKIDTLRGNVETIFPKPLTDNRMQGRGTDSVKNKRQLFSDVMSSQK